MGPSEVQKSGAMFLYICLLDFTNLDVPNWNITNEINNQRDFAFSLKSINNPVAFGNVFRKSNNRF